MSDHTNRISRRSFTGALAAAAGLPLVPGLIGSARAQAAYPNRNFRVVIPTGQGGGAELLARAMDGPCGKALGQRFEYSYHPGAGGQIGYELFVSRRDADGYNLLFGNMGPEIIMYVTQKPSYKFPEDFIYFCRTDVDDSCVFVRADSPIKDLKTMVEMSKKRPLNVALSRIPHPATIGMMALAESTSAQFNYIPYGGGNPTFISILNGEADVGALPIANVVARTDKFRVLGVFNNTNMFAKRTNNAPTVNSVFGTSIPELSSSRSWAVHTKWADANPKEFALLQRTAQEAHASPVFREAFSKTGAPVEALVYGDRKVCTDYALNMIKLAQRYESQLTAKRGKK
jgi:tripartite-type tricarboxylate transporter receptor subunit TctC